MPKRSNIFQYLYSQKESAHFFEAQIPGIYRYFPSVILIFPNVSYQMPTYLKQPFSNRNQFCD